MPENNEPLREAEVGSYGELLRRPNPLGLVIFPVPAIEVLLMALEQQTGRPLTESEIEEVRNGAASIVLPQEAAQKMNAARATRS